MKASLTIGVVLLLAGWVAPANSQKGAPILDQIARSLPAIDPGLRHSGTESFRRADGITQATIKWIKTDSELGATVMVHATLKSAKRAFLPSGKEDLQEGFRIGGVGDEAFLWPPKTPEGGAYNIRFRKANVEVWMGHASETELKRFAQAIASVISPPGKRKPNRTD